MARALIALLAPALAGCIDFVEPELAPAPDRGSLQVVVFQDETFTRVAGLLVLGRDNGKLRDVVQPTLWLAGHAIQPDAAAAQPAQREYEDIIDARAPADLLVRIPQVSGVAVPHSYHFTQLERSGPRELTVVSGEPIIVRLTPPADRAQPAPDEHAWILAAFGASTSMQATGRLAPPDSFVIPAALLPPEGTIEVVLTEHQAREAEDGSRFHVRVQLARRILWTVQIIPAS